MIIEDWEVKQLIQDTCLTNTSKLSPLPLPDFDSLTFPFIICTGKESINLINVKVKSMQVLIETPANFTQARSGAFFTIEDNTSTLHFAGVKDCDHLWYSMDLKKDLLNALKKLGRLPHPTMDAYL